MQGTPAIKSYNTPYTIIAFNKTTTVLNFNKMNLFIFVFTLDDNI